MMGLMIAAMLAAARPEDSPFAPRDDYLYGSRVRTDADRTKRQKTPGSRAWRREQMLVKRAGGTPLPDPKAASKRARRRAKGKAK